VFVLAFPGVFRTGPQTLGEEQISSAVWWVWHFTFPVLVICATVNDSALPRLVSRRAIGLATAAIALTPFVAAIVLTGLIVVYRESLPHVIVNGVFQPLYTTFLLPLVTLVNALACAGLLARRRALTPLVLWLAVAMFSETLDCLVVKFSHARFSYAWDGGKLMTVFTASIVLVMMLRDVVLLYDRLTRVARIDALTTLHNRRAYEEHFGLVFQNAQRLCGSLGVLLIDIDFFKRYNDLHGHLTGDECLRRVALEIASCAQRPLDMVARYGGEEFVVVLPDTSLAGVRAIADRIRILVEQLQIVVGDATLGGVTVSIGIGYAENVQNVVAAEFFEMADRALYDAKEHGRNIVMLGASHPAGLPQQCELNLTSEEPRSHVRVAAARS
jgi:diguanylate cyclase (GGDEF)-like protein